MDLETEKGAKVHKGCSTIERQIDEILDNTSCIVYGFLAHRAIRPKESRPP
jgi:hypothetical protein